MHYPAGGPIGLSGGFFTENKIDINRNLAYNTLE